MKDYYRILGVLDDAEDIIIKAAYRALAQRYHPDKWSGDQVEATKRMAEINEAYSVLSEPPKRKEYDNEFFKFRDKTEKQNPNTDEFEEFKDEELEAWTIACDFFPSLKSDYKYLRKYDVLIANTFRTEILDTQDFKNSFGIRKRYEADYLDRYFGSILKVQEFAKKLIFYGAQDAAVRLNKIIKVMGEAIDYATIKNKINQEFPSTVFLDFESKLEIVLEQLFNGKVDQTDICFLFNLIHNNKITLECLSTTSYRFPLNGVNYMHSHDGMVQYLSDHYKQMYQSKKN
jgi:curved DNA-binding protein CbpA